LKYRYDISVLKGCILLELLLGLTGCGVRRLEDVLGPGPSLAQPPKDTGMAMTQSLAQPPADVNVPPDPTSPIAKEEAGIAPAERLSPLLAAQEDRTLFSDPKHWIAFQTENGVDATNAAGTMCSGRINGDTGHLTQGQKILLACSDGKNAALEIRKLIANGADGVMIIDKVSQSVTITKSEQF
jgi:hypothetical protein